VSNICWLMPTAGGEAGPASGRPRWVSDDQVIPICPSMGRDARRVAGLRPVAEFEAGGIRERATAGLRHAARHGTRSSKAIGRPATIASRATEIRSLASAGESIAAIARKLHIGYASAHRVVAAAKGKS
jgi:DNA invertase Pin-like site-specific DNA recombinase